MFELIGMGVVGLVGLVVAAELFGGWAGAALGAWGVYATVSWVLGML